MTDGTPTPDPPRAPDLRERVALAPMTTLGLGGPARFLVEIEDVDSARDAISWAQRNHHPLVVLGGGSNVVVADTGFPGVVLRVKNRDLKSVRDGDSVLLTAGAGEIWDGLVAEAVDLNLAGLECLSGIPGTVGAAPIQNIGAYGQEVATVIEEVRVLDLSDLEERSLPASSCRFGYRSSIFRQVPGRYLVLDVTLRLRAGGAPTLAYEELVRLLAKDGATPALGEVRQTVLGIRRSKSMVIDDDDPNRRSVGSFFVNPVVDTKTMADLRARAGAEMPSYDAGEDRFKIPAAWLIERAGFTRGLRRGSVGISTAHTLALVHHDGGTSSALVALAREIRDGVFARFGLELKPEPVFLGFEDVNPLRR